MHFEKPFNQYFSTLSENALKVSKESQLLLLKAILATIYRGNSIYVAGNGGSAAVSMHFVTDLIKIGIDQGVTISAFDLASNNSLITCIGNDYGYDKIFEYQLKTVSKHEDLFIAISSSGNSSNILNALGMCNEMGVESWAIIGFKNSKAARKSSKIIELNLEDGQYGIAEDLSAALCHNLSINIRNSIS